MKKTAIIIVSSFLVGIVVSPILGMAISPTRNLILGMAPDEAILVLADKIDEESGRNNEQEQKLSEQDEKISNQQDQITCESRKSECLNKISPLEAQILEINKNIKKQEADIAKFQQDLDGPECGPNDDCSITKRLLDKNNGQVKSLKNDLSNITNQLSNLKITECKDYQNPCE